MLDKKAVAGSLAFRFVLLVGIVNLFADFTYEGARSITGPFLVKNGSECPQNIDLKSPLIDD